MYKNNTTRPQIPNTRKSKYFNRYGYIPEYSQLYQIDIRHVVLIDLREFEFSLARLPTVVPGPLSFCRFFHAPCQLGMGRSLREFR